MAWRAALPSAAFVVGSSAVGMLIDRFGEWAIWGWLFGVSAALIAASAWMKAEPVAGDREAPFIDRLKSGIGMLKDRKFALLIFSAGLIQATHSYFYVAGTLIWTNDQQLSSTLAGNLWSVGVIAEVGFLIFLARWTERFAPETLILVGAAVRHHPLDGAGDAAAGLGALWPADCCTPAPLPPPSSAACG